MYRKISFSVGERGAAVKEKALVIREQWQEYRFMIRIILVLNLRRK